MNNVSYLYIMKEEEKLFIIFFCMTLRRKWRQKVPCKYMRSIHFDEKKETQKKLRFFPPLPLFPFSHCLKMPLQLPPSQAVASMQAGRAGRRRGWEGEVSFQSKMRWKFYTPHPPSVGRGRPRRVLLSLRYCFYQVQSVDA